MVVRKIRLRPPCCCLVGSLGKLGSNDRAPIGATKLFDRRVAVRDRFAAIRALKHCPFIGRASHINRTRSDPVDDLREFILREAQYVRPVRALARLVKMNQFQIYWADGIERVDHHGLRSGGQAERASGTEGVSSRTSLGKFSQRGAVSTPEQNRSNSRYADVP